MGKHDDAKGLWSAVLLRVIRDADGKGTCADTRRERREIQQEAVDWLTKPEFEEQRVTVCEAAGVDRRTLARYVEEKGLHRGLNLDEVRTYKKTPKADVDKATRERGVCPWCGTHFVDCSLNRTKVYCSAECRKAASRRKWADKAREQRQDHAPIACAECGGAMPQEVHGLRQYCSIECSTVSLKRRKQEAYAAKSGRERRTSCAECGGAMPPDASLNAKYCGEECSTAVRKRKEAARRRKRREASRERAGATS